ncbi:MAG TPA: DNA primase [Lachnospiraceae bacterium]|nr:DNA primase [Lachnospiraceae bacterium]
MRYSDDIIEEVRNRNDIVDVVSEYVRLQRKGSSYFGLCPFHNEKSPSFSVTPSKQMFYCFGCGVGGNVYTFLMEYENATFPEAVEKLAARAGIELPRQEYSKEARQEADLRSALLAVNKEAAKFYYIQLRTAKGQQASEYLKNRQISEDTMKRFGLGYSDRYGSGLYKYLKSKHYSDQLLKQSGLFNVDERRGMSDKFWNRVIYPIMDINSRVIGFGGRVMGDGKPKYLNSPETKIFDKSRNLYGLNIARSSRKKNLIICEGYMDVIAMHQAGFTNAVASLGTALTSQQCSLMKRFTNEVLVIYDSDGAGVKAALRAVPLLREAGLSAKVIDLSPHKDPDEFIKAEGAKAFEERLEQGVNGFLYEIDKLQLNYDVGDPQGKADFLHEAARRLCRLEDEIERNAYLEAIAGRYGIGVDILRKLVNRLAMQGAGIEPRPKPVSTGVRPASAKPSGGTDMAQRLMLTWLASYPSIYEGVRQYITLEDFTDPMYHRMAELLFGQYDRGEPDPAGILSHFEDLEEQKKAAAVLHARLRLESDEERQQALKDVIFRMKSDSLKERMARGDPSDPESLMTLMREKKELEEFRMRTGTLHISIN